MSQAALVNQLLNSQEIVGMFDRAERLVSEGGSKDHIFEQFLNEYAELAGTVINALIPTGTHPDMDRYLYGPLMQYSQNGGKRHRPLICVAAAHAVGGDHRRAFSSAAAIEHFHTAALIHDDIADEAELRRGEPCMHLRIGEGLAINAGDLALSIVNGIVMRDPLLDDATKVQVALELVAMAQYTVEGQALDIGWAQDGRYDLTLEDYFAMAIHKTAHYSGAVPLAVGAIVGGGTPEQIEGLRQFGLDTGLAFQIQDDVLNLVGTEEQTKKDFRNDITEGKRTLIVVHALENSTQKQRLIEILSSRTKDPNLLAEAVQIMEESGSIQYARDYADQLCQAAKKRLVTIVEPSISRDLLESMADWFVERLQ
jgi:geranylgeranyl diphosphate synthase type I